MSDRDDKDMLAAEFVLGTLDRDERDRVHRQRQHDSELEQRIGEWESRLAPLADEIQDLTPGPDLLPLIQQRIKAIEDAARGDTASNAPPSTASVTPLHRRLAFWKAATGLSSAAAVILAAVLLAQPSPSTSESNFVAVFQQDDRQPAFMLSVNLEQRRLHVRPVSAEPLPDRSYQLWIKHDDLGSAPRSVGVLDDDLSLDQAALRDYEPELLKHATFGISVEPPGGSPTGQPTGPAIHGYLYPTEPSGGQRL
ncbi:anti-sigma factor [Halomonas sp. H10-59]|uniref:Anti-sigma factor n=1 Tax=Halomonas sp. H10-59 TaxID=2950874 RepID=A0AAU7KTF1_9GAMM